MFLNKKATCFIAASLAAAAQSLDAQEGFVPLVADGTVLEELKSEMSPLSCSLAARDEATCDATVSDDGTNCVWCEVGGFGLCLTLGEAERAEEIIPTIQCDLPSNDDDDDAADDDDHNKPPPTPFWACLETTDPDTCASEDCVWCTSKAGYGICLGGDAAKAAEASDFYECKCEKESNQALAVNAIDKSCVIAMVKGQDCAQSVDAQGNACEICSITGPLASKVDLCVSPDQAMLMEELVPTATCKVPELEELQIPDISCIIDTAMGGDENSCLSSVADDGSACEWCNAFGYAACVTEEQAETVEPFGAVCESGTTSSEGKAAKGGFDTACAMAIVKGQDCSEAVDADGNSCEMCSVTVPGTGNLDLCMSPEQAALVQEYVPTATCKVPELEELQIPDISCIIDTAMGGDENSCLSSVADDGSACEWCSAFGYAACVTEEQAETVEPFGAVCESGQKENVRAEEGAFVTDIKK